jgi:hypothetical protein
LVEKYCAFYRRLPEPDRRELEGHIQVFLAEKIFEGCGGLTITDEIKVCIAAHACLLLLHRNMDYYPALQTILVDPSHYFGSATQLVSPGVLAESQQDRLGESWGREGVVVLAWDALCSETKTPEQGENVVFHEFAHQLDYESGSATGGVGINMNNPNGASLYVQGNRSGGTFNSAIGFFENTSTATGSTGSGPALRVVCDGGSTPAGALSVSDNGTGPIAEFGNGLQFVASIENDGTITSKGVVLTSDRNSKPERFS